MKPLKKNATYDDLREVPDHCVAEMFDGDLYVSPWVCEVLSPSTERLDRGEKLRIYARERVTRGWLIEPSRQTLEVLALNQRGQWIKRGEGRDNVRAAPLDAIELDLGALWI